MIEYEPLWLQKATKLDLKKHAKDLPGRWLQTKLDGVGGQAVFNSHVKMYGMSKAKVSGEFSNFTSKVPHIVDELASLDFEGILQGEILATHLPTCAENAHCVTGTLHADNGWERQDDWKLSYVVYDIPTHMGTYADRYAALQDLIEDGMFDYISLNPILGVNENNSWETIFNKVVAEGGEGIILYDPCARYKHAKPGSKNQRNRGVIKVKAEDEREVLCVELIEGEGKYSGTLGAMICEDGEGRRFNIGSFNITDAERQEIWDNMKVPFVVEMIYYMRTEDSYKLPRLTRIRLDKDIDSWNKNGD